MEDPKSKATLNPDPSVIQEGNLGDLEDESICGNLNPHDAFLQVHKPNMPDSCSNNPGTFSKATSDWEGTSIP